MLHPVFVVFREKQVTRLSVKNEDASFFVSLLTLRVHQDLLSSSISCLLVKFHLGSIEVIDPSTCWDAYLSVTNLISRGIFLTSH